MDEFDGMVAAGEAVLDSREFGDVGSRGSDVRQQVRSEPSHESEQASAFNRDPISGIIGRSKTLRFVLDQVEMVAPTDATALIIGETGTGKELIASAIHASSFRWNRPFVRVNCGSIPSELFESEFFGHVKGSFTGAVRDRLGRFQYADRGTLFLDEIGEIPMVHQAKLLRVLQEREFERVGEDATRRIDVRIVAATNRDLRREVADGRFREDLYYRLSVFPIELPALRERKEDIPALATHFADRSCERLNRPKILPTADDIEMLQHYDWPGNIRQLQNVIERAVILARDAQLRLDLAFAYVHRGSPPAGIKMEEAKAHCRAAKIIKSDDLSKLERENILAALEFARWKISGVGGAAELLGINPSTLASRLRTLGIRRTRGELNALDQ